MLAKKAEEVDPLSLHTKALLAWQQYQAGVLQEALAKADEMMRRFLTASAVLPESKPKRCWNSASSTAPHFRGRALAAGARRRFCGLGAALPFDRCRGALEPRCRMMSL